MVPAIQYAIDNWIANSELELDRMRAAARTVESGIDAAINSIATGSEYIGHPPMVASTYRLCTLFKQFYQPQYKAGGAHE